MLAGLAQIRSKVMVKPTRLRDKWRIRWIDETGRRRSAVYDDYKVAQHELRLRQVEVEQIRRGLRDPRPPSKTVDELCDYWIKHRASRKRSGADDVSIIRCHLRPCFGHHQLRHLHVQHIDEFVASRTYLNPKTLSNILTLLKTMLSLGKELGWLERIPQIRKPRIRLFSQDFHYLRDAEEVRRFLAAAAEEEQLIHVLYAAAVFTGMRAGELAGLPWSSVSFDRRLIVVQHSFTGPTKAGDVRHVPILNTLLPILRSWRLRNPLPLVFPNSVGRMFDDSARVFQDVLHRVLERGGFPLVERNCYWFGFLRSQRRSPHGLS